MYIDGIIENTKTTSTANNRQINYRYKLSIKYMYNF